MAAREDRDAGSPPSDGMLDQPNGRGDVAAGLLCLLTAVIGAFVVVPIWVYVPEKVAGTLDSPAVMPLCVLGLLGLFGLILLANTGFGAIRGQSHRTRAEWLRACGMIAICAGYLALILLIGLPVATGIALAAAMVYFGETRPIVILPVAVITPLLLWAFFAYIVYIPMPQPLLRIGTMGLDAETTIVYAPSPRVPV